MQQHNTTNKSAIKPVLLSAMLFMLLGTALELYLLHHFEDNFQLIPLFCIGVLITLVIVSFFYKTNRVISFLKLVLILTALSGFYGTYLHLNANYEFELEMKPTANSLELILESLSGALPTLAPCSMIVLALIGYSYILTLKKQNDDKI